MLGENDNSKHLLLRIFQTLKQYLKVLLDRCQKSYCTNLLIWHNFNLVNGVNLLASPPHSIINKGSLEFFIFSLIKLSITQLTNFFHLFLCSSLLPLENIFQIKKITIFTRWANKQIFLIKMVNRLSDN